MANKQINQLPENTAITSNDLVITQIAASWRTWKTTKTQFENNLNLDNVTEWSTNKFITWNKEAYTESNVTTSRTIDADSVSLNELADVVWSLLVDLRTRWVIS